MSKPWLSYKNLIALLIMVVSEIFNDKTKIKN